MRTPRLLLPTLLLVPMMACGQVLSPSYTFTAESFAPVLQVLPGPLRAAVQADPKAFLEDYKVLLGQPEDLLFLVDKKHELPADYEPGDLVALRAPAFEVSRGDLKFRKAYLPALTAMTAAARKDGLRLVLSSSYRSWIYQRDLFQRYVNKDGLATAERYSARPGQSQHQLATVIDFGSVTPEFAETREGRWLAVHAGEYGFSLSFPQGYEALTGYVWEPWHYRFIGREACAVQDKWFGGVQQYLTEFHHTQAAALKAALKK